MGCTVETVSFRAGTFAPNANATERILDRWPPPVRIAGPPDFSAAGPAAATARVIVRGDRAANDMFAPPPAPIHVAGRALVARGIDAMTAQTLPDNANVCFVPTYDVETDVQRIRIVIEGLAGHIPAVLVSRNLTDALSIDKLNRHPGLDRMPGSPGRHNPCAQKTTSPIMPPGTDSSSSV